MRNEREWKQDVSLVWLPGLSIPQSGKSALVLFEGSVLGYIHLILACLYLNALQITCTNKSYYHLSPTSLTVKRAPSSASCKAPMLSLDGSGSICQSCHMRGMTSGGVKSEVGH